MGALGRQSRVEEPLIFVTELVAFFEREAGCAPSSTAHCQIGFQSFEVQGPRIWAEEDSWKEDDRSVMDRGGATLAAPLLFAVELTILYAAGYYAMGRLMRISGFGGGGSVLGRIAFYLLMVPGVVLHEGAHYLACLLTGTKVSRFAPFSPGRRSNGGRLMLGYVRHERRAFPIGAIIGLAPILLNPVGLLFVTALLTPLTFQEVAKPSVGVLAEGTLSSGFLTDTPLLAAVWAYLSLSLALGSVPSREDLSGLPLVLLVFGGGILLIVLLRMGSERVLSSAVYELSTLAAGLYAMPATVAVVAALTMGLGGRTIRH